MRISSNDIIALLKNSPARELNKELLDQLEPVKKSKYGNKKTVVDNHEFDSKGEATRYFNLKLKMLSGLITDLQVQQEFKLSNCTYKADFTYYENGEFIVEDFKGKQTREYIRKRKLMKEELGIEIRETK